MASVTPSAPRQNTHAPTMNHGSCLPPGLSGATLRMSIAGIAEMSWLPVAYPADDAVDTAHVFSRIDMSPRTIPRRFAPCQIAYERMQAVRFTPRNQPVFSPM